MGGRVLITRPEPGATRTAKRLAALGREPVLLPLTDIRPLTAELPAGCSFDAVAVSSANALRHAGRSLLGALAGAPLYAVGQRTADAAEEAGVAGPVVVGPGDAQGLASLIAGRLERGSRVLYLCGRMRSGGFEPALAAAGIAVLPVETYDTTAMSYAEEELAARLGNESFEAALFYSRMATETFARLTDRSAIFPLFDRSGLICISERAARPLYRWGGGRVRAAATPDEKAMLALLAG